MICAIVIDGIVDNVISVESKNIQQLQTVTGGVLVDVTDIPVQVGDIVNDGLFYREGDEITKIPPLYIQIRDAIDAYTLQLLEEGAL